MGISSAESHSKQLMQSWLGPALSRTKMFGFETSLIWNSLGTVVNGLLMSWNLDFKGHKNKGTCGATTEWWRSSSAGTKTSECFCLDPAVEDKLTRIRTLSPRAPTWTTARPGPTWTARTHTRSLSSPTFFLVCSNVDSKKYRFSLVYPSCFRIVELMV